MLAHQPRIDELEERAFRMVNGAPDAWRGPVRAVMQAGTFATVPIAATVALFVGRRRLAVTLATGGTAAWLLAKVVKSYGGRPRPAGVLEDVTTRERIEGDLGWVSGHTAVATTLALVAAPEVPAPARPLLAGVVAATGFGRMYVGAHLPLDLVGGAGLGMMVASVTRWLTDG